MCKCSPVASVKQFLCGNVIGNANHNSGLDRPLGLQEVEASRISRHSGCEGGKVINPAHRMPSAPRPQEIYRVIHVPPGFPTSAVQ